MASLWSSKTTATKDLHLTKHKYFSKFNFAQTHTTHVQILRASRIKMQIKFKGQVTKKMNKKKSTHEPLIAFHTICEECLHTVDNLHSANKCTNKHNHMQLWHVCVWLCICNGKYKHLYVWVFVCEKFNAKCWSMKRLLNLKCATKSGKQTQIWTVYVCVCDEAYGTIYNIF